MICEESKWKNHNLKGGMSTKVDNIAAWASFSRNAT